MRLPVLDEVTREIAHLGLAGLVFMHSELLEGGVDKVEHLIVCLVDHESHDFLQCSEVVAALYQRRKCGDSELVIFGSIEEKRKEILLIFAFTNEYVSGLP